MPISTLDSLNTKFLHRKDCFIFFFTTRCSNLTSYTPPVVKGEVRRGQVLPEKLIILDFQTFNQVFYIEHQK